MHEREFFLRQPALEIVCYFLQKIVDVGLGVCLPRSRAKLPYGLAIVADVEHFNAFSMRA